MRWTCRQFKRGAVQLILDQFSVQLTRRQRKGQDTFWAPSLVCLPGQAPSPPLEDLATWQDEDGRIYVWVEAEQRWYRSPAMVSRAGGAGASGETVSPELQAAHLLASGTGMSVSGSVWYPTGKVQYGALRTSDSTRVGTTSWSTEGESYSGNLTASGLVVGTEYRLQYRLDCIPDVDGWDDATWRDTQTVWTQPTKAAAIDQGVSV